MSKVKVIDWFLFGLVIGLVEFHWLNPVIGLVAVMGQLGPKFKCTSIQDKL